MFMTIRERETMDIKVCSCGAYPVFVKPEDCYTDIWLECPKCGKQTKNTGGYNYGYEIPLEEAKRDAIREWNKGN